MQLKKLIVNKNQYPNSTENSSKLWKKYITGLIHSKGQATNECFDKFSADMRQLMKSLELPQDQINEELAKVRKRNRKIR